MRLFVRISSSLYQNDYNNILFQKNPIELKVSNVKICYFFSMIE